MADVIRTLGLIFAAASIGGLLILAFAPKGTTGFATPARYWGVAAGLLIEVSGIYYRLSLWGSPFNPRDLVFLTINILIGVSVLLSFRQPVQQ